MRFSNNQSTLLTCLLLARTAHSISLDVTSVGSISAAVKIVATQLSNYFWDPTTINGVPQPYYWWMQGAIIGSMVDYWAFTGDTTFNNNVTVGWLRGVSPSLDLQPDEQVFSEGNDDQGFWSIAGMDATERKFPETDDQKRMGASYLAITQTVFNLQTFRWDNATCNGGMRWQIVSTNPGYTYKNTISNGLYFQLGARLARYTQNDTYAELATRTYKWLVSSGLVDSQFYVNDGASVPDCATKTTKRWTYNYGTLLAGCAAMYNYTNGDSYWKAQIDGLFTAIQATFIDPSNGVVKEYQCQDSNTCNNDQPAFKGFLARWMAYAAVMAPYKAAEIYPIIATGAQAAAGSCVGQPGGNACSLKWNQGAVWDGDFGLGEQLSAMEQMQNVIPSIAQVAAPVDKNQGTSEANPGGTGTRGGVHDLSSQYVPFQLPNYKIALKDRVGAAILTIIILVALIFGARFTMLH